MNMEISCSAFLTTTTYTLYHVKTLIFGIFSNLRFAVRIYSLEDTYLPLSHTHIHSYKVWNWSSIQSTHINYTNEGVTKVSVLEYKILKIHEIEKLVSTWCRAWRTEYTTIAT